MQKAVKAVELKNLTTFHIGGKAQYFYIVNSVTELQERLAIIRREKLKYYLLGGGSNILVQDSPLKGAVIKLGPGLAKISRRGNTLVAGGAVTLPRLLAYCRAHSLTGAEFLWGIPGTIGGAVKGNAGTKDKSISDLVKGVTGVSGLGKNEHIPAANIFFTYRGSNLGDIFIITEVELALHKSSKNVIKKKNRYLPPPA